VTAFLYFALFLFFVLLHRAFSPLGTEGSQASPTPRFLFLFFPIFSSSFLFRGLFQVSFSCGLSFSLRDIPPFPLGFFEFFYLDANSSFLSSLCVLLFFFL